MHLVMRELPIVEVALSWFQPLCRPASLCFFYSMTPVSPRFVLRRSENESAVSLLGWLDSSLSFKEDDKFNDEINNILIGQHRYPCRAGSNSDNQLDTQEWGRPGVLHPTLDQAGERHLLTRSGTYRSNGR